MRKKNISLIFICVLIYFLFSWVGCTPREFCPLSGDMDFEEIATKSEKLKADIYIDASLSMKGFVNQRNSYYIKALQLVERAFISGWPDSPKDSRNFYKFGINIYSVSRDTLKEAEFTEFYPDDKTHIEKVIDKVAKEKEKKEKLSIIITDLFQNQQDVNLLIEKLNNSILSKEMAVGLLGIKSQFNGTVGDVDLITLNRELAFEYSTVGKKFAEYRPFYLLMFGKYNDLVHYYNMMKINGLDSFPEKNFIILAPQLVERLASFDNAVLSDTGKITEVRDILNPSKNYSHVKQFRVKNSATKAYFDAIIQHSFLSYVPKFDPQKLAVEIIEPKKLQEISQKGNKVLKKELGDCKEAYRAFTVKTFTLSGSQLKFRTEIYPGELPGDGIYCFTIIFHPPSESYSLPQWISDWNMDERLIEYWKQNPDQFKGNATLNLKNFLNNIWQIIYLKHKPKIARLYCYIKKE